MLTLASFIVYGASSIQAEEVSIIQDTIEAHANVDTETKTTIKEEIQRLNRVELTQLVESLEGKSELTTAEFAILEAAIIYLDSINKEASSEVVGNTKGTTKDISDIIDKNLSHNNDYNISKEVRNMTSEDRVALYEELEYRDDLTQEEQDIKDYLEENYRLSSAERFLLIAFICLLLTGFFLLASMNEFGFVLIGTGIVLGLVLLII